MSPDPILLIPGTHGYRGSELDANAWWWSGDRKHPPSLWVQAAQRQGLVILSRPGMPFIWDTRLSVRRWRSWKAWGDAAIWYCLAFGVTRVQLLGYSHGGQLAAYACRRRWPGFTVSNLVTVGTPPRADMQAIYIAAREHLDLSRLATPRPPAGSWEHVYGGQHRWWARFGLFGDGAIGWSSQMPEGTAHHNTAVPAEDDLMAVATWDRHDLWRFLR